MRETDTFTAQFDNGTYRMTDLRVRIVSDPDTLFGKPRIKGTRIGVQFLLDLMGSGWSEAQILDSYPQLQPQDLKAVRAFVSDGMNDETSIIGAAVTAEPHAQDPSPQTKE